MIGQAPAVGFRPTLLSRAEYLDEIGASDASTRIDLEAAYQAPPSPVPGNRTQAIGPLMLKKGATGIESVEVAAACIGPGNVDVTIVDGDSPTHYAVDCASGTVSMQSVSISSAIETNPISVTADAGTSWIVFVVTRLATP